MTTYRTLAIVDDVHTCDCCGKSNLKCTVAMESEAGEIVHFGTTCATRHSGRDLPTITRESREVYAAKLDAAIREYKASPEFIAREAKFAEARRLNIAVGREFAAFVREAKDAANAKANELAAKYGVNHVSVY